jgi:hypothetical protein
MANEYPRTVKDEPYPHKLQVTLEGGPFHGQVVFDWGSEARPAGERRYRKLLLRDNPSYGDPLGNGFRAVYELKRWNEAGTAGIAECIDDGKPKCKDARACYLMELNLRNFEGVGGGLVAVRTKGCGACGRPLAFEVRQVS